MEEPFDKNSAKKFLSNKEQEKKEEDENLRKAVLKEVKSVLYDKFKGSDVQVFLVGSITKPYMFKKNSDIDIVLKNFNGDRFDVWVQLESKLKRSIEVILYEKCHFKEYVIKEGLKVL